MKTTIRCSIIFKLIMIKTLLQLVVVIIVIIQNTSHLVTLLHQYVYMRQLFQ